MCDQIIKLCPRCAVSTIEFIFGFYRATRFQCNAVVLVRNVDMEESDDPPQPLNHFEFGGSFV